MIDVWGIFAQNIYFYLIPVFYKALCIYLAKASNPLSVTNLQPLKFTFSNCLQLSANKPKNLSSTEDI